MFLMDNNTIKIMMEKLTKPSKDLKTECVLTIVNIRALGIKTKRYLPDAICESLDSM